MLRTICAVAFSLMIGLLPVSAALACVAMPGQECPRLTPWLVFFDWNSDAIPPDRLTAINEVAIWWKAGSPRSGQKLTMSGYTDRSLPADQALELTERMAKHVADALVAAGVARDEIAVTWYGDEFGRVPTEPGIKEPQNRRVEMWFQFDPIPGVYLCDNLSIVDGQPKVSRIKTADFALLDGSVYVDRNGQQGQYTITTSTLKMTSGGLNGVPYYQRDRTSYLVDSRAIQAPALTYCRLDKAVDLYSTNW